MEFQYSFSSHILVVVYIWDCLYQMIVQVLIKSISSEVQWHHRELLLLLLVSHSVQDLNATHGCRKRDPPTSSAAHGRARAPAHGSRRSTVVAASRRDVSGRRPAADRSYRVTVISYNILGACLHTVHLSCASVTYLWRVNASPINNLGTRHNTGCYEIFNQTNIYSPFCYILNCRYI